MQMIIARFLNCLFTTAAVGLIFNIKMLLLSLMAPCVKYFFCSIDTVKEFRDYHILPKGKKGVGTAKDFAKCWVANTELTENKVQERNMCVIECRCRTVCFFF